jgi:hypothetical protein
VVVGVACAGCGYGNPRTNFSKDGGVDSTSGGGLDSGADDDRAVVLSILSPPSPTYTNASVTIEVTLNVATANGVRVLKNGSLLAELADPPYSFAWDTKKEVEGGYQLVAQSLIDGEIVMSQPVAIVVDRTPPEIVSSVPASGDTNVSLTDPIRVVFSEALAPATIVGGAVRFAFGSVTVNATATLGADGKTIDVAIADRSSLVLPGSMTETVGSTITDLAGNPFGGATWSASVPIWVDMGTIAGGYPQMVLGVGGAPVVVTGDGTLRIARYMGGTTWDESIPSPEIAATNAQRANTFGIATAKIGDLFVTWVDSGSVQVARWTGTAWDRSWTSLSSVGRAINPAVAVNAKNAPVVYWEADIQGSTFFYQSNVSEWNGTGWTSLPGLPMGPCNSVPCRLILDKSERPAVEVNSALWRWSGSMWSGPSGFSAAGLALNASDQVLSVQDTETALQVVALSSQGSLTNYVPVLSEPAVRINPDETPQLAVDSLNQPIVVWYYGGNLHVARWTGSTWDQSYGVFPASRGKAAIVVAQGSIPILARQDQAAGGLVTRVTKSNH